MTTSDLQVLIEQGDRQAVFDWVAGVDGTARSTYAKSALKMAKELGNEIYDGTLRPGESREQCNARRTHMTQQILCAWLVTYRLGAWEDIQKLERGDSYSPNEEDYTVLIELLLPVFEKQPPSWIEKWVTFLLDKRDYFHWSWIRRLMKAGVVPRPATDNYVLSMPRDIASLRADPDVLHDELYSLFRIVPSGTGPLIAPCDVDEADNPEVARDSLAVALRQLSSEGLANRSRLLSASLESLLLPRRPNDAIWFYRFHEFLKPTLDERVILQASYCELLASPTPTVVSFALDAFSELVRSGRLNIGPFLDATKPVFSIKTKGPATTTLKLLSQLAKDDSSKHDVALAVAVALSHESPDVQKSALGILEGLKLEADPQIAQALVSRFESVAASLKDRAAKLVDRIGARSMSTSNEQPEPEETTTAIPASVAATSYARLSPARAIIPINTSDELIEEAASIIEQRFDVDRFERFLDGLSRLCDQRPEDFAARTAPLLKRIEVLTKDGANPPYTEVNLLGRLMQILKIWWRGTPGERIATVPGNQIEPPPPPPVIPQEPSAEELRQANDSSKRWYALASVMKRAQSLPVLNFLEGRLEDLVARLRRCDARPLLAAPTHRGGWIDANAFVERLRFFELSGLDPQSFDLRQALLRIAAKHRDEVLSGAAGLTGSRLQALEWALDRRNPAVLDEAADYIAAKAGKDPFAPLLASDNPPVLEPLTFTWRIVRALPGAGAQQPRWALTLMMSPNPFENPLFRYPPLTLCPIAHHASRTFWTEGKAATLAQVWPVNPAPLFAAGAVAIVHELETTNNDMRWLPEFLEPMFDAQTPFSEMAQLVLAVSLLAKSADLRNRATDALIAVVSDERCQGSELGRVLGRLHPSDMIRCNRLAEAFRNVSRCSPRHMSVCSTTTQAFLSELPALPDDAHHLMAPLVEWLTELNQPIHESLRPVLLRVTGTGKAAKLAKALLKR